MPVSANGLVAPLSGKIKTLEQFILERQSDVALLKRFDLTTFSTREPRGLNKF